MVAEFRRIDTFNIASFGNNISQLLGPLQSNSERF